VENLFARFDKHLTKAGYLAMGGQIVDATLVAAPKQRNTQEEKDAIKAGKTAREVWPEKPAKAAQKDVDARWTVKFAKARTAISGKPQIDIAIPSFGYKNHIAIDQRCGFIRKSVVTHGARHDGSQLREVVTTDNTASDVWADTAYRSKTNEAWLAAHGRVSRIHRKKPRGKPRSERLRAANRVQIKNPCAGRACLCAGKSAHGAVYPHYRHQTCRGQDHPRQSGLQHEAPDLPRTTDSGRISAPEKGNRRRNRPIPIQYQATSNQLLTSPEHIATTRSNHVVDGGAQLRRYASV